MVDIRDVRAVCPNTHLLVATGYQMDQITFGLLNRLKDAWFDCDACGERHRLSADTASFSQS